MLVLEVFELLVGVLDHHHGGVHHRSDGNGDPAQRHDVGVDALRLHHDKRDEDAQWQRENGHQCRAQMKQEDHADHRYDQKLFDQLVREVLDSAVDEGGAVVGLDDLHPLGQAGLERFELGLHGLDGAGGIGAGTQHDDATHHFTLAIEFCHTAPGFGTQLHGGDVT